MGLFLPLFFAFTGLRTNLALLTSPGLLLQAAIVIAAAVIGKVGVLMALVTTAMTSSWLTRLGYGVPRLVDVPVAAGGQA